MADEEGYVDVSFAKDGGILKKILKEAPEGASGPPPSGNEVEAHYTGKSFKKHCTREELMTNQQVAMIHTV